MQASANKYNGRFVSGTGDVEYLSLLDTSLRMLGEDPEVPNISMDFTPEWNGLQLGSGWDAWWIQNTYGPTFCMLPFLDEPYTTFIARSNDLWFKWIGNGKQTDRNGAVGPDGCLCDAARPDFTHYRQGDGDVQRHDFALEMTGAGIVIQGEMLLISRDMKAIEHYLPMLERSAEFVESRRNPDNDLFLVGFAGNLLGPSWVGTIYPDGRIDKGYLAGMSVTYVAALDRLIELEKLAGSVEKVRLYEKRRYRARQGLRRLLTDEGYFVKGIDLPGVKHGVYGADRHGYFESNVNHDAVALGVVDLDQSKRIMDKMCSIKGLRPHGLVISNYPSLDDQLDGDYGYGNWVNGGHWSTSEARMMLAYHRVGRHADAVASMNQIMKFFRNYLADAPLTEFGNQVWFRDRVTTVVYDVFGAPAGLIRGLLQPVYSSQSLTLTPSLPDTVTSLEQRIPLRFGDKRIGVSLKRGKVARQSVTLNGKQWADCDAATITLPYRDIPRQCTLEITLPQTGAKPAAGFSLPSPCKVSEAAVKDDDYSTREAALRAVEAAVGRSPKRWAFERGFARSVGNAIRAYRARAARSAAGCYSDLPEDKRKAIVGLYRKTADDLITGFERHVRSLQDSGEPEADRIADAYLRRAR